MNRTCETCACSQLIANPQTPEQKQMVCRLDPPMVVPMQAQGRVAADPRGSAQATVVNVLMHRPTAAGLTCWKWQPPGSEPGDLWYPTDLRLMIRKYERGQKNEQNATQETDQ